MNHTEKRRDSMIIKNMVRDNEEVYGIIWHFMIAPWLIAAGYTFSMLFLLNYIEKALLM